MPETYFERFSIVLTKEQALSASHQGSCDADVRALLSIPKVRKQLSKINPDLIRAELKEYGAWDESELSDDESNAERIIWLAAGNIREELRNAD